MGLNCNRIREIGFTIHHMSNIWPFSFLKGLKLPSLQHFDEALFEVDLVDLGGGGDVLGRVDRVRLQHGRQHRVRVPGDDSELISGNGIIL